MTKRFIKRVASPNGLSFPICHASVRRKSDVRGRRWVRDDFTERREGDCSREGSGIESLSGSGCQSLNLTNEAIGDTARKVVKAKVFRLNGSRYKYKYSHRRRIVIVDHGCAHSLTEYTYTEAYNEYWGAGIQCVCTRKEKYFCFLSPAQTCTIKTL